MLSRLIAVVAALLLFLTLGVGCYESKYSLGSAAAATVNRAYVGDFVMTDKGNTCTVVIRNLDNKHYYVEYAETKDNGKPPLRMTGYTADLDGVTFANLRPLSNDGSLDNNYLIMGVSLSPDHSKLLLRNLKEEFFKGKNIGSSQALTRVIEANLDNEKMYDGKAVVFTRKAPATQP